MLNPAANTMLERMYGIVGVQSVKMEQKEERTFLTQEDKGSVFATDLKDPSVLKDLIVRSRNGDIQAMEAIYERFNRSIFNLVYRYTYNREIAEDLLQDIFIKIFTRLQDLRTDDIFVGWLYRIAINTCYSYLRKNTLQRTLPLSEMEGRMNGHIYESGDRMIKESLDDAIQSLSVKLKTIFLLHDVQGFKHREIALMLDCAVGTSKSQLFKARVKIRKYLKSKQAL
ncbi:MAG: sigma-70 family RNA polymerase sigma factor [Candidatus Aminicenantes bacterium]|nr:sigma-70 family RNA polymerase sigma factor [Candidatus Aminicenantes bacterium]